MSDRALTEAKLAEALRRLDLLLVVYDREGRLLHASPAVCAHIGLPPEALAPGMSFAEVARLMAYHGFYGPGDPESLARAALAIDRREPSRRLVLDTQGRYLEVVSLPLPDGGLVVQGHPVTSYITTGRAAREQAGQLRDVLQRLETGVALFGPDGALRLYNAAFERLMAAGQGLLREGVHDREILAALQAEGEFLLDPEAIARLKSLARTALAEVTLRRTNGRVLRLVSRGLADQGYQIEVFDITQAQRAEDEARRRAVLLDGVLEALPVGVTVYGVDRRVLKVNSAMDVIMNGAPTRVGEHLDELIARRQAEGEFGEAKLEEIRRHYTDFTAEGFYHNIRRRPNGAVVSVRRARLPDGGHVTVISDVTALDQAEKAARERAGTLQVLLDSLRQGVCLIDAQDRVVVANEPARRFTGLGPALRQGATMEELTHRQLAAGEFTGPVLEQVERYIAAGRPLLVPYERHRPNGTIIKVQTEPVPGGLLRVYEDITEERRIRRELELAKEAAEAASRAKSRFLATMSHELRTPLNAVIGFAEALRLELKGQAHPLDYAQAIEEAGRRLLDMIDSILEVSSTESGLPHGGEPFDLAAALKGLLRGVQAEAEAKSLRVGLDIAPASPRLALDARRFYRVMEALLSNAVKFTGTGGALLLRAAPAEEGAWRVSVVDTGIGIAPEDIPRAFEPFTQLENGHARHHAGTGMGLYLARTLASAMGCAMSLESEPAKGTTVTVTIPAANLVAPRQGASS